MFTRFSSSSNMVASCNVLRLLFAVCLSYSCLSTKSWFVQVRNTLLRPGRMEYLKVEKMRLQEAVQDMSREESVLREENAELKRKVNSLNSKVSSLRKREVLLLSEHQREVTELDAKHAASTSELQDSFKKSRSKENALIINKLKEQHNSEKTDLRASLGATHAVEINALKKLLSTATASLQERDNDLKQLNDKLALSRAETREHAEKIAEVLTEKEALIEGIKTLSESLEHMKRAEAELRAIRMEEIHQAPLPSPQPSTDATSSSGAAKKAERPPKNEKLETGLPPVSKNEGAELERKLKEEPERIAEIPEGMAHIRPTPIQAPPPSTAILQHQHTSTPESGSGFSTNVGGSGRTSSKRKAGSMRVRRSFSANSTHT